MNQKRISLGLALALALLPLFSAGAPLAATGDLSAGLDGTGSLQTVSATADDSQTVSATADDSQTVSATADDSQTVSATADDLQTVSAADPTLSLQAESAILVELNTGKVLCEKNADTPLPPASVTKIMTVLLVVEAIDSGILSLSEPVTVSTHASSMGGSQIYLKEGEQMSAEDLLKSVVVASANDAAVALAEHLAGSEEAFVARMNERAAELGMVNTHFENTNGLDDTTVNHKVSARDIAIMSCELLHHKLIYSYTTLWMDSVRDGAFTLTNTNRLIRFYRGATGLKTGSTSKAGFCISASAERDGLALVAVIMGSPTRDIRNAAAASLLDYGFAHYSFWREEGGEVDSVPVTGGKEREVRGVTEQVCAVLEKGKEKSVKKTVTLSDSLAAPVHKGDTIGEVVYFCGEEVVAKCPILAAEDVMKINYLTLLRRMLLYAIGAGDFSLRR